MSKIDEKAFDKAMAKWREKAEYVIRHGRVLGAEEEGRIIIEAYEAAKTPATDQPSRCKHGVWLGDRCEYCMRPASSQPGEPGAEKGTVAQEMGVGRADQPETLQSGTPSITIDEPKLYNPDQPLEIITPEQMDAEDNDPADAAYAKGYAHGYKAKAVSDQPDERCEHCGWPIVPAGEAGCWKNNCSMRPMPPKREPTQPDDLAFLAWQTQQWERERKRLDDLLATARGNDTAQPEDSWATVKDALEAAERLADDKGSDLQYEKIAKGVLALHSLRPTMREIVDEREMQRFLYVQLLDGAGSDRLTAALLETFDIRRRG